MKLWSYGTVLGYSTFSHIFTAHAQKRLVRISNNTGIFPLWGHFAAFDVLCSILMQPCDLNLWPFDLDGVSYIVFIHIQRTYQFWASNDYMFLSYWCSHFHHMERSLRMSRDISPGAKIIHILIIHDPYLSINFVTVRELRRRLQSAISTPWMNEMLSNLVCWSKMIPESRKPAKTIIFAKKKMAAGWTNFSHFCKNVQYTTRKQIVWPKTSFDQNSRWRGLLFWISSKCNMKAAEIAATFDLAQTWAN